MHVWFSRSNRNSRCLVNFFLIVVSFYTYFLCRVLFKKKKKKRKNRWDNTVWMRFIILSTKYGAPYPLPVAMVILADPQPVSVLYLHWMNSLLPTSSKVRCKIGILTESGISYQAQVSFIWPSHKIYTLGDIYITYCMNT